MKKIPFLAFLLPLCAPAAPDEPRNIALQSIAETTEATNRIALEIWRLAELGYKETQSSALLQKHLADAGFTVETGVAGMPTAFVASYGAGKPVIAILGEYDALPGLAQEAVPERKKPAGADAGHGCGHNLFGPGSAQAAIAVKAWMQATGQRGTIRFYGCPAEEGGAGKAYMARAGLFDDVDAALHWHPNRQNMITWLGGTQANMSVKFRFHGKTSHAASSPEIGRSALKGVEVLNYMTHLLREHTADTVRMHYVITRGGEAPNVVPDFAEVFYYLRDAKRDDLMELWKRVQDAARGAALGTGTEVKWEINHGAFEVLPNDTLAAVMHKNLVASSDITYDAGETAFAEKIAKTLAGGAPAAFDKVPAVAPLVHSSKAKLSYGSSDVGDVSWNAPTVGAYVPCWVPGTRGHTWQATASSGSAVGLKGMNVAARMLALTAIDLFTQPETLAAARAELERRRGPNFKYTPIFGDRAPPLDYRD